MSVFDPAQLWRAFPAILDALQTTLLLTLAALAVALLGGAVLCLIGRSRSRLLRGAVGSVTAVARATPEIAAIFWAYYCLPVLFDIRLSAISCVVLVLGVIGAGYVAEIARGAIAALPKGQWEAARALALPTPVIWLRVILPQVVPRMLAPLINYLTELLKATTLASAIGVSEVAYAAYIQGADSYRYVEPLTAVAVIFFLILFPLSLAARRFENTH